ncbi:DUF2975 domain-containing protein [Pseudomonas sp. Hp2]|uniref:DUF2975 domain-containing protein n=1 Tax=Pseudomonas sp. Hp2 TaxID=701189 RepID=UPI0015AAD591|nr:DUF2975 domain-containing protein [Pseudomonas sp. Hp2]
MQLIRAARRLRWAVWLGVVLVPLLTLSGVIGAWQGGAGWGGATLHPGNLGLGWATALAIAQGGLVAGALHQLAVLLGQVAPGQVFPPQAARRFGRFAALLLCAVLVHGVLSALLEGWSAYARDGGRLVLDIDAADLLALLVAAVLWLVARFFAEASRLEEDQRSIV